MEWFQFITLMATIIGGVFAFHKMTQDQIHKMEENHKELRHEMREEFKSARAENSKRDALWANLLDKIYTVEKQIYNLEKRFSKTILERSRR